MRSTDLSRRSSLGTNCSEELADVSCQDTGFFEGREVSASIWNICPHRDVVSALSDLPDSDIVREHDDPCRCA